MREHVGAGGLEQVGQLLLAEPYGLAIQPDLDGGSTVVALVEDHLTARLLAHAAPPLVAVIRNLRMTEDGVTRHRRGVALAGNRPDSSVIMRLPCQLSSPA